MAPRQPQEGPKTAPKGPRSASGPHLCWYWGLLVVFRPIWWPLGGRWGPFWSALGVFSGPQEGCDVLFLKRFGGFLASFCNPGPHIVDSFFVGAS